jgi:hypothetical protein
MARITASHNGILMGRLNTVGLFTLTANVATSTLTDARISIDSTVVLVPTTANASAEIGAGTIYQSETGRVNGTAVFTHANNAQTDRTYRIVIIG